MMRSLMVVEVHPFVYVLTQLRDSSIAVEAYPFIFKAAPYALYKDVVSPATYAIHAYGNVVLIELSDPLLAGKLPTLIGVKHLRCSASFLDCLS